MCVCLPSFYPINEREREERFPFRKSGDKGDALNAESPEGKLRNLPTQGKFLVSLNPSNCSPGQVLAAKSMTVTQQMNKFKLAFGTVGIGAKERDGLYLRMFQSIWGQKFWQNRGNQAAFWSRNPGLSPWVFVSGSDIHLLWDLGQVLLLLRALISRSEKSKGQNTWHLSSPLVLTSSVEEVGLKLWISFWDIILKRHLETIIVNTSAVMLTYIHLTWSCVSPGILLWDTE